MPAGGDVSVVEGFVKNGKGINFRRELIPPPRLTPELATDGPATTREGAETTVE